MIPSPGDFLILDVEGKSRLARASDERRAILVQDLENESDAVPVKFGKRDVLANLGKSPRYGSVHGVKVEILHKRNEHSYFGPIRFYTDFADDVMASFRTSMKQLQAKLQKQKLPQLPLEIEVRNPRGKMKGTYKYRPQKETDVMVLYLGPDDVGIDSMEYTFSHEYAHGLHARHVTNKTRANWVKLYHDFVVLSQVSKNDLKHIREGFEGVQDLAGFNRDQEEDIQLIIRQALRQVKQVHSLDKSHLQQLLSAGESLENIWPTTLEISSKELALTDYAKKSPEELFAESFAFQFTSRKLPKKIALAMDNTLSRLVNKG